MAFDKFNFNNLCTALRDPELVKEEFRYQRRRATLVLQNHVMKHAFLKRHGEPIDVITQDWDNLIILDACRYDVFAETNWFDGHLEKVISRGSTSDEFMLGNFRERELHDTIYVTGNGNTEKLKDEDFFTIVKTYDRHEERYRGWMPDHIREVTLETHEEYPNKRLIVHFMQPHTPYIGPKARALRDRLKDEYGFNFKKVDIISGGESTSEGEWAFSQLRDAARAGYLTQEQLYEVYVENLEVVLGEVERLLEELDGKSVLTSDHGELLGSEDRFFLPKTYGHPGHTWTPELRYVPWLEIETGPRREVVSEEPIGSDRVDEEAVQANLEALGYL